MKPLIEEIENVFLGKKLPKKLYNYSDGLLDEIDEVLAFSDFTYDQIDDIDVLRKSPPASVHWKDVTSEMLNKHSNCFSFFSDEAFEYYLPSAMMLSLKENDPYISAIDGIIYGSREGVNLSERESSMFKKWLSWLLENGHFAEDHKVEILEGTKHLSA